MVGSVLLAMASCATTSSTSAASGAVYTCCEAADIDRDYQPGEPLTVRWIVTSRLTDANLALQEVELNASLAGPYVTVGEVKSMSSGENVAGQAFAAEPIRPSGQAAERPVSVILIPSTAAPGFYKLTTSVTERGESVGGMSVIHVVARR
jgi:hypothetical protein